MAWAFATAGLADGVLFVVPFSRWKHVATQHGHLQHCDRQRQCRLLLAKVEQRQMEGSARSSSPTRHGHLQRRSNQTKRCSKSRCWILE